MNLEVEDDCLDKKFGVLDLNKVKPLMMLESDKGMHRCQFSDDSIWCNLIQLLRKKQSIRHIVRISSL